MSRGKSGGYVLDKFWIRIEFTFLFKRKSLTDNFKNKNRSRINNFDFVILFRIQHPAGSPGSAPAVSEMVQDLESADQPEFSQEMDQVDSAAVLESPVDPGRYMGFPTA